ncbi:MAG TPA: 50S ribosomal protein L17 [Candidatus Aphodovivens excrementavium]|nr:50S ribosomal protein L17 [Candidatus Aphodovivens excrementavium]
MRHYKKGRKLGTDKSHTKAMKRSLVSSLLLNDRIKTVESRAKEIRPDVDKIITWAKKGDLHSRRLAIAALGGNKELVREVFEKVAQGMFQDRQGGYTRIMKLGYRKGDNAPMVIMELVTEPVRKKAEKDDEKPAKKTAAKKAQPKKAAAEEEAAEEVAEEAKTEEVAEEAAEEAAEAAEATEAPAEEAAEEAEAPAEEEEKKEEK